MSPALMFVEGVRAARTLQILLFLAAAEWVGTGFLLVEARRSDGQPWMRLAAILGSVALFTAISALTIRCQKSPGTDAGGSAAPDDKKNDR